MDKPVRFLQEDGEVKNRTTPLPIDRWPTTLLNPAVRARIDLVGTPGLMRAPAAWKVGPMSLQSELLYLPVEGSFDAIVGATRMTIARGELLWIAHSQSFQIVRRDARPITLYRFRLNLEAGPRPFRLAPAFLHLPLSEGEFWFDRIVREAEEQPQPENPMQRGFLLCLMTLIARRVAPSEPSHLLTPAQRRAISDYVSDHMTPWPRLHDLAKVAGLSVDYFSRRFRQSYGLPVREWLVRQRIQQAIIHLAETSQSIGEVSRLLGYRDIFYFSRQFRQVTGVTPTQYRQNPASTKGRSAARKPRIDPPLNRPS